MRLVPKRQGRGGALTKTGLSYIAALAIPAPFCLMPGILRSIPAKEGFSMQIRLLLTTATCLLLAPMTASAFGNDQTWESGFGQGVAEAIITQGAGNEIYVTCDSGAGREATEIRFTIGGKSPAGSRLTMVFDGQAPEQVWIADGGIKSNCRACAGTYQWVVERLKKHARVHVMTEDGATASFSLKGASKAIGDCVPDFFR